MRQQIIVLALAAVVGGSITVVAGDGFHGREDGNRSGHDREDRDDRHDHSGKLIQYGPRPYFLMNDMADSRLKRELESCSENAPQTTDFTIGHRGGATLQFPEETREDYEAGIRMGAGIIECDVVFTKDKELVCRHAQNDLHTTTNILLTPLASKCFKPFTPATFDASGNRLTNASAECRTTDITLAEFKTLRGKMDGFNPAARTAQEFVAGTPNFRTDLYSGPTSGHLLSHKESIELIDRHGLKFTPELKSPAVTMPFNGFTQAMYEQKMIDEYKQAGISPHRVFPQSFDKNDILYWIQHDPAFGRQAVFLDDANVPAELPGLAELMGYKRAGINIVGPPTFALVTVDAANHLVPSDYAMNAKAAGLDIITWTLERSGVLALRTPDEFYYQTVTPAISREGDTFKLLDVLARQVGIRGIFTDWAATVTYYANCMGIK
jgi:glycerophosphoryl diester phosphodiesterase